jgi:S-DNA-T family DNA segregation ATPase FtsK/SpoIIIE
MSTDLLSPEPPDPQDDPDAMAAVIDLTTGARLAPPEPVDQPDDDPPYETGRDEDDDAEPLLGPAVRGAGRLALRQGAYVVGGAAVTIRRRRDARGLARYERFLRAAEAAGDHQTALEWDERKRAHRQERHERRMALLTAPVHVARALVIGAGILLAFGILAAIVQHRISDVIRPFADIVDTVTAVCAFVDAFWRPGLLAALGTGALALWQIGRTRAELPGWLAVAGEADIDATIDETTIAQALGALRIPQITAHLKAGLPMQFLTLPRVDGRGTHAVLRLPSGVPAEKIAKRRADLATGLYRAAKEVWPTTGSEAGILDLWIADKGALAEGAGPYPLLDEAGPVDVFKGVPFGRTLRGDPIVAPLAERNTITGGMPGQGKSSAARVLMAGAALDPTCELRIWVPDSNFDFEAFAPRCTRYVMGAEDEKIGQILTDLRELHAEVQRRGKLLIKYEEPSVTRKLASRGVGLHPLVCLLEEAHVAIQHPKYGKEISQLLIDIVKLGRKRFVHLIVSTQAPTKDSMPRDVTRNCSNGIAFAVGDHVANDALLGQGAYAAGHRATELIPGVDRGVAIAKGLTGERSEIVQVYFLDISKGNDQTTGLIRRSLELIAQRGAPAAASDDGEGERLDPLADIATVLGEAPRLRTQEVLRLLAEHNPTAYADWGFSKLSEVLAEHDAAPHKVRGIMHVSLARVREALAERDENDAP